MGEVIQVGIMRVTIIMMLAAVYLAAGCPDALLPGGSPYVVRALFYPLFHANIWHLLLNCTALWGVLAPQRTKPSDVICALVISFAVYPLSLRPVVGVSNFIYAVLGLRTPPLRAEWWRQPAVVVFLIVTVAMLAVPQFSATTHIAAFLSGVAIQCLRRWVKSVSEDARI